MHHLLFPFRDVEHNRFCELMLPSAVRACMVITRSVIGKLNENEDNMVWIKAIETQVQPSKEWYSISLYYDNKKKFVRTEIDLVKLVKEQVQVDLPRLPRLP